jgi:hypothetical protein
MRSLYFIFLFIPLLVCAQEPLYCLPKNFYALEQKKDIRIIRGHTFKLGQVELLGAAIGLTSRKVLVHNSPATTYENYCTWYFNEGNPLAEKDFNHYYVTNPKSLDTDSGPKEYRQVLSDQFAQTPISFLNCIEKYKYLAMGCNGQMHRGPTVFGMLLSFSGCQPAHAAEIVNTLWGLNGVSADVRLSIITEAYRMGTEDTAMRLRMQQAFKP